MGKGTLEILTALALPRNAKMRYYQLAKIKVLDGKSLKPLNDRTLRKRLQWLESNGLIRRKVVNTRPPTVYYSIEEDGRNFLEILKNMAKHKSRARARRRI